MVTVEELKKFDVFSNWDVKELAKIVPYLKEESVSKNNVIFRENDPAEKVYLIRSGCVELKIALSVTENMRLARMKSGEIFGEMSVFDQKGRSATAEAFIDTNMLVVEKDDFCKLLKNEEKDITNKLLISIVQLLSSRLRDIDGEIRNLKYGM